MRIQIDLPDSKYSLSWDTRMGRYICGCKDWMYRQFDIGMDCKHIIQAVASDAQLMDASLNESERDWCGGEYIDLIDLHALIEGALSPVPEPLFGPPAFSLGGDPARKYQRCRLEEIKIIVDETPTSSDTPGDELDGIYRTQITDKLDEVFDGKHTLHFVPRIYWGYSMVMFNHTPKEFDVIRNRLDGRGFGYVDDQILVRLETRDYIDAPTEISVYRMAEMEYVPIWKREEI